MSSDKEIVEEEIGELGVKIDSLLEFTEFSDVFQSLPEQEQDILDTQAAIMASYYNILLVRLGGME